MQFRWAILAAAGLLLTATLDVGTANAETGATTNECSDQWAKMKAGNNVADGLTWPKFLAQCTASASGAVGTGQAGDAAKVIKVATIANEGNGGNVEKKACDAKWGTYKTEQKVHGWKAYFTFMADCM